MGSLVVRALVAAVWLGAAAGALAGTVRLEVLGDLPGGRERSESAGVSADGSAVAGTAFLDPPIEIQAFHWTRREGMIGLGVLPLSHASAAVGISGDGRTVVGRSLGDLRYQAFRWSPGAGMRGVGFLRPQDTASIANAASFDGGFIVGSSGSYDTQKQEAFRWTEASGMTGLGILPGGAQWGSAAAGVSADGSVVVGNSGSSDTLGFEAFRWTESTGMVGLGFLSGRQDSIARAVSADGRVIVGASGRRAFRWTEEDGMVAIADGGEGSSAIAYAASADGSVVVGEVAERAFIWDEAHGLRDLTDLLRASGALAGFPDTVLVRASGVSADGTVLVGDGRPFHLDTGDMLVWRATLDTNATVVPLPPAAWAGLVGLAVSLKAVGSVARTRRAR
jgi:probable HAF family extracellular repeat protein